MTGGAWARDAIFFHRSGRDEPERMGMNERAGNAFGFYRWHVAGDALRSWTAVLVMRVLFQRAGARAVRRCRPMTIQTDLACGLS